jgi:hypothetical protein
MQPDALDAGDDDLADHPTVPELVAAALLAASVILHIAALFPQYYGGASQGSLWSEPDQAAQYLLLAAGWGLALGIALTGPARARLGAALAVGVAATEFGFRLSDLGEVFRSGPGSAAAGLWLMTAAWVVGAAGAVLAVVAVRARSADSPPTADRGADLWTTPRPWPASESATWAAPAGAGESWQSEGVSSAVPLADDPGPAAFPPETPDPWAEWAWQASTTQPLALPGSQVARPPGPDATAPLPAGPVARPPGPDATAPLPAESGTTAFPNVALTGTPFAGAAPTVLVGLLALATAGAFLPAWDHYAGVATSTGRAVSFNLGDAFTGPWQVVIGTVLVAAALVVIPLLATRMRSRAAGAALVAGALIVLATQFTAALVQVDHAVPPSLAGLSAAQANQLGLHLRMTLTGWFTFDLLAAFALFVTAMVIGHVREVPGETSSVESWPGSPYAAPTTDLPPV